ncbi:MAG: N-acetylmuramoyl-L-alanine amidase [Erysipelotrichaceae bacterium]|nr:N-acetylmuramoyl-L-alanine amidase [Erysipelotrichaceae bacterium]
MRQYKTLIIVLFFLSIFCFSKVNAMVKDYSLLGKTIYLDAGHGGRDSGAISNTFLEKDMNLLLVKKLEKALIEKGAMVFLTRDGDYDLASSTMNRKRNDLYNRVKLINNSNCDMYISMHLNASPSSKWNGIQLFYSNVVKENKIVAETITNTMKENMKNVRDVKKENGYYMYSKIKVPGVLVEAGFISNANDNYKIRQSDYQDILINNIVRGIENYFNKG